MSSELPHCRDLRAAEMRQRVNGRNHDVFNRIGQQLMEDWKTLGSKRTPFIDGTGSELCKHIGANHPLPSG
jgi:hypothetical protein